MVAGEVRASYEVVLPPPPESAPFDGVYDDTASRQMDKHELAGVGVMSYARPYKVKSEKELEKEAAAAAEAGLPLVNEYEGAAFLKKLVKVRESADRLLDHGQLSTISCHVSTPPTAALLNLSSSPLS